MSKASVTPDQISTFSIYKGINALYRPNNINNRLIVTQYRQVPIIALLYAVYWVSIDTSGGTL